MRTPDYTGGGLVNLVAEIEHRMSHTARSPRLTPRLRTVVPEAHSYVLVLMDGLGDLQLDHRNAAPLAASKAGALDASFSTQTTVNTSTIASGLPPSQHGLIAYLLRIGKRVLNTIYWYDDLGEIPDIDPASFLPEPNLAERLGRRGVRVVATEPAVFVGSPLDRVLYRSAESVGTDDDDEAVERALEAVHVPGTLALVYLPHVDAAAHAAGQDSDLYADAVAHVAAVWQSIVEGLPAGTAAVGVADHGHVDVAPEHRVAVPETDDLIFYGDNRVVYVTGPRQQAVELVKDLPATWVPVEHVRDLWGPAPYHPRFLERLPDGLLVADDGFSLVPPGTVDTMVGHHGGLTEAELRVPLLVAGT